jgi:hypothetical protein
MTIVLASEEAPPACAHCGAVLPTPARFCHMCGRSTAAQTTGDVLPARTVLPAPSPAAGHAVQTAALVVGLLALGAGLFADRARIAAALNPPPRPVSAMTAAVATPPPALPVYELLTLDVPAGGSYRLTFPAWPADTTLEGYFRVAAQDVAFRIQQPDGSDLVNLPSVSGRYDFVYTTPEAGQYSIVFTEQSTPLSDRQLVLVYREYVSTRR